MRSAIVRAAILRGWVCPMLSKPSSMSIFGIWVVFPEPVAPATITTWLPRIASSISSLRWLTGRSGGKVTCGGPLIGGGLSEDISLTL